MGRFTRRDRIVNEKVVGYCLECTDKNDVPFSSPDKIRMWAKRHAEKNKHSVRVTITTTREYLPKEV